MQLSADSQYLRSTPQFNLDLEMDSMTSGAAARGCGREHYLGYAETCFPFESQNGVA